VNSMTAKDNSWVLVTGASSGFGEEFYGNSSTRSAAAPCGTAASLGTPEVIE
jgi:hypothetical protein